MSEIIDPKALAGDYDVACRQIADLKDLLARKNAEIKRLKKVLRQRKYRRNAPARQEWAEREARGAVIRDFIPEHYSQLEIGVIRQQVWSGFSMLLGMSGELLRVHAGEAGEALVKRAEQAFPNLRRSPLRAFVEGKLTGGVLPSPDLRYHSPRLRIRLLTADVLETISFELERELLGVRAARPSGAKGEGSAGPAGGASRGALGASGIDTEASPAALIPGTG